MSTGAIVAIVVVVMLATIVVMLRIAVATQRRAVDALRARLAAAGPARQRAEGVQIEGLFHMRGSVGRSKRVATCTRTDDGLYCLSDDGRWGWRLPFAPGAPHLGDIVLSAAPCLVNDGIVIGDLPAWLIPMLASLPPEALVLPLQGGSIAWIVGVPDADVWYAELRLANRGGFPPSAGTIERVPPS